MTRWGDLHARSLSGRMPAVVGFVVFFFGGVLFHALAPPRPTPQPIAFNHAKHVSNGMACTDCHIGAQDGVQATLPTASTCITCHETALTQSAEEAKLRSLVAGGQELTWHRLTRVPAHVYFSHRRHVSEGGLACAECHGPMERATAPPRTVFRTLSMNACLQCHQQRGLKSDCNDCHR